jgi:hypothetical protein
MIDFFFDFETRRRANLADVGAVKYCLDSSTEATLLTWCFSRTGVVKEWRKNQPIPDEILDVARDPEKYRFIAHNVGFDYLVWTLVFSKLIKDFVKPSMANLEDNMAITCHFRVGGSLENAATTQ